MCEMIVICVFTHVRLTSHKINDPPNNCTLNFSKKISHICTKEFFKGVMTLGLPGDKSYYFRVLCT